MTRAAVLIGLLLCLMLVVPIALIIQYPQTALNNTALEPTFTSRFVIHGNGEPQQEPGSGGGGGGVI